MIREFLLLVSKKNARSTLAAGFMLTALAMGEPSTDRLVLLVTHMVRGSSVGLTSGSVGGVPLAKIVDLAGSDSHLGISDALVQSGTTATVQLTPMAKPGRNILMGVYSLRNYKWVNKNKPRRGIR